jgi:hypothetical protein
VDPSGYVSKSGKTKKYKGRYSGGVDVLFTESLQVE